MHLPNRHRTATVLALVAVLGLAACGDDSDSASANGSTSADESAADASECVLEGASDVESATAVDVTLTEFVIAPLPEEVPAGAVEFRASNEGHEPHELVIARYDGDVTDLPTDRDGGVDEDQLPNGSVIGEIEEFAAGQSCAGTFELEAGNYALFCNIIEEEDNGETEAHYGEGMVTVFTVT